jgi:choline dehydrogenase-like flavoprotein
MFWLKLSHPYFLLAFQPGVPDLYANRAHDAKNLWVLDGASFTSYNEKNPTLTVIAVALRAAEHLARAMNRNEV